MGGDVGGTGPGAALLAEMSFRRLQSLLLPVGTEKVPVPGGAVCLERVGDHLVLGNDDVVLGHKVDGSILGMPDVIVEDDGREVEAAAVGGAIAAAALAGAGNVRAEEAQAEAEEAKAQAAAAQATADVALSQPAGVSHEEVNAIVEDKMASAIDRLAERLAPAPTPAPAPVPAEPQKDQAPASVEKEQAKRKTWRECWEGGR